MGYELGYLQEVQAVRVPEGGKKKMISNKSWL